MQPAPTIRARRPRAVEEAPRQTWCRVRLAVSLVPPAPGKLFSLDKGPRTLTITACAPKAIMLAAVLGLASAHPGAATVIQALRQILGW